MSSTFVYYIRTAELKQYLITIIYAPQINYCMITQILVLYNLEAGGLKV